MLSGIAILSFIQTRESWANNVFSFTLYPKKSDQNTLVIRGRVLGVVASSDRPSKDDIGILEELFVDEIREFNEEHGVVE